ncbi:ATP-binding response regulator [Mucilaginibacter ginsenosidivorans]|uniref:Sensor histidine kinase n=1 Tax=Mucilaginibacter ginsenosidivorans TaxID=398053 RepID=A0A5B8UXV7_9SPHI|nr:sensor histidine kinase [Mucilaginibacter ginsenosidivorans]QEC64017.1 sensor histidine kinase [Mucilaginibacter ginsenosidivorans]
MPNKGDHNILIIEDNPGDLALVEEFLFEQIESPVLSHVSNFVDAKNVLTNAATAFDIILLDLSLPDKTGTPLIEEIIKVSANAAVIVLTGYSDLSFGLRSLSLGVSDYILKDELTSLSLYKSIVYSTERKRIALALETSEKRARRFAKQLNSVVEEERLRIAREIHDEFGQQLSGLKMSMASLKKNNGVSSDLQPVIEAIVTDVDNSIQTLRLIANELRPALLDKLGLFAAIEWLVSEFERKTGIQSKIYVEIDQPSIDRTTGISIFRICQEALTNIAKHAAASLVSIRLESGVEMIKVYISDNGKGIDTRTLQNSSSMGLLNMRERASLIGAELNINSVPGKGTNIELKIKTNGNEDIDSR